MSIAEIINSIIDNWFIWFCFLAFFYAGYNLGQTKHYEEGFTHGYRRGKLVERERTFE